MTAADGEQGQRMTIEGLRRDLPPRKARSG
jgi:hypothetical protein